MASISEVLQKDNNGLRIEETEEDKASYFSADSWLTKLAICIFIRNFEMLNEELEKGKHCCLFAI